MKPMEQKSAAMNRAIECCTRAAWELSTVKATLMAAPRCKAEVKRVDRLIAELDKFISKPHKKNQLETTEVSG